MQTMASSARPDTEPPPDAAGAPRVLVVGGGIGGLSAAIALRRVGVDAQVFERAPELREVGAGISLWPNATRVLARWGVLAEVEARAFRMRRGAILTQDGRLLQPMSFADGDAPHLLIHRAALHAALADALPAWALHLGAAFGGVRQEGGGVRAEFTGLGEVEGDALVGADGLRSAVRAQLLGDGAPTYRGYPVWRGVVELGAEAARIDVLSETLGRGLRFGIVPIGGGRVAWWASANEPEGARAPEGIKARLLRLFRGWHDPIPRLLAATPESEILRNDTYDRPPVRRWGRGRVTLLGDAAHPTTPNLGQGGCMAIEDAEALARAVVRHDGDLAAAFRHFERRRYARTAGITRQSRLYGWIAQWERPWAVRLREGLFRATAPLSAHTLRRLTAYEV